MSGKKFLKKVIVMGDAAVGKSSLVTQVFNGQFKNEYKFTIGTDFVDKKGIVIGKDTVDVQLWDTAGQERFRTLGIAFYRTADAFIIVFDVNNRHTFNTVEDFKDLATDSANNQDIKFILVGNKVDEGKRVVSKEEAEAKAKHLNIPYIETSAKTGANVKEMMTTILQLTLTASDDEKSRHTIDHKAAITRIQEKLRSELTKTENSSFEIGFFGSSTLSYSSDSSGPKKTRVPNPIKKIFDLCASAEANKISYEKAYETIYDIVHNKVLRLENTKWNKFILWIRKLFAKLGIPSVKHPDKLKEFYQDINTEVSPYLSV